MTSKINVLYSAGRFIGRDLFADFVRHGVELEQNPWIYQQMAPRTVRRPAVAQIVQ